MTYTVRLTAAGDGGLRNVAWLPADPVAKPTAAPDCADSPDSQTGEVCAVISHDLPRLKIVKTVDSEDYIHPGDKIAFTVTATNTGEGDFGADRPLVLADDLTEVIDGMTYNNDAKAEVAGAAAGDLTVDLPTRRLYWVGELAKGETVVISYSFTAAGHGNGLTGNTAWAPRGQTPPGPGVSPPPAPSCVDADGNPINGDLASTGEPCAQVVEARPLLGLSKTTTVEGGFGPIPGAKVTYTITGANVGAAPYTADNPVPIWDDLTGVLAGAAYNDDAAAKVEGVAVAAPVFTAAAGGEARDLLKWQGALGVGEEVVITYSVTLGTSGAGRLRNVAWAPRVTPFETPDCDQEPPQVDDPDSGEDCAVSVLDRPLLEIAKSSDADDPRTGDTVHYTITAKNVGNAAFTTSATALVHDDLTDVLDDAVGAPFNLTVSREVNPNPPAPVYLGDVIKQLRWEGVLAVGATVKIEYDVTLRPGGNGVVENVAWSPLAGNRKTAPTRPANCDTGLGFDSDTGEPCDVVEYKIPDFSLTKSYTHDDTNGDGALSPGDELIFTIDVKNDSNTDYTEKHPLELTDSLASTLGDATLTSAPVLTLGSPGGLAWTLPPIMTYIGALKAGESAQIQYTVVLTAAGDGSFRNIVFELGGTVGAPACAASTGSGIVDPVTNRRCARVDVEFPVLRIAKSSNMPSPFAVGKTVAYQVVVTNIGAAPISGAKVVDDLGDVIDNGCADWVDGSLSASTGSASYGAGSGSTPPRLTWKGDLGPGQSATIAYQVTTQNCADSALVNVAWQPADSTLAAPDKPECKASPLDAVTGEPCAKSDSPLPAVNLTKTYQITRDGQTLEQNQVPRAGDVVTYTIVAEHAGGVDYTEQSPLVLRDDLTDIGQSALVDDPSLWTAVWYPANSQGDKGAFASSGGAVVWTGTLVQGQTVTLKFSAELLGAGAGRVRNVVWEPANPYQPNPPVPECGDDGRTRSTPDEACAEAVFVRPALKVTKQAMMTPDRTPLQTGDTVVFTVTIENTGAAAFTAADPARFYDSLEDVLSGASYNNDAAIVEDDGSKGTVSCVLDAEGVCERIEWQGPLAVGASVSVTFSATLEGKGEAVLYNVAWAPTDQADTDPPTCQVAADGAAANVDPVTREPCDRVELPRSLIHVEKVVAGPEAPRAGDTLTYSVAFRNIGDAGYDQTNPAHLYDDLSEVLKNAKYNDDAKASGGQGEIEYSAGLLHWSGALPAWAQVTITYTVTLTGGGTPSFTNVAWVPADGDETDPQPPDDWEDLCPPKHDVPDADEVTRCASAEVDRGLLTVKKEVVDSPALPHTGDLLTYQVTMTNTGRADYSQARPAALRDDLTGVLTGAYYQAGATAQYASPSGTAPAPSYSAPYVVWSGPLAAGQSVTVTYKVLLRSSETAQVANLAWSPNRPFTSTVPPAPKQCDRETGFDAETGEPCAELVLDRGLLTLSKTVNLDDLPGSVAGAGDKLTYTVEVKNISELKYEGDDLAVAWVDVSGVLAGAVWVDGSESASAGTATYIPASETNPVAKIKWSGPLAPAGQSGDTATFSYQVVVAAAGVGLLRGVAWVPFDQQATDPAAPTCEGSTDGQPVISISQGELCAGLNVYLPQLAMIKLSTPTGPALVGDLIAYQLIATNIGAADFPDGRPAVLWDDLGVILDDADLVDDSLEASTGQVGFDADTNKLTWQGALKVNAMVVIDFKVKVVGGGDGRLRNVVYQPFESLPGSPVCDQQSGQADPATGQACAFDNHPLPKLTLAKELLTPAPWAQGKQAEYKVTIANTGAAAFTQAKPAVVVDDISDLLDGGVFNHDQKAVNALGQDVGALSYAAGRLTWSGALGAGEAVTLTYSVTWLAVGDGQMSNVAWQPVDPADPGDPPACLDEAGEPITAEVDADSGDLVQGTGGVDPGLGQPCAATLQYRPLLEIEKKSTPSGSPLTAGDKVFYTVTAKNVGQAAYTNDFKAVVEDSLSALLGATLFNHDAQAKVGGDAVDPPVFDATTARLRWEGPLEVGQTVTITFSITLLAGGVGVGRNVAWSPVKPELATPPQPICSAADAAVGRDSLSGEPCDDDTYFRPTLSLVKSSDAASPKPGDIVKFTLVATNTSAVDFTKEVPAIVQDYLGDVLDDASFVGEQPAQVAPAVGDLVYDEQAEMVTWSGALKAGESVTITIEVELLSTGDGYVRNVAWRPNVPGDPTPPACDAIVVDTETVQPCATAQFDKSGLELTKTANPPDPMPGATVAYTLTLKNTGRIAFTDQSPVWLWDDLAAVLAAGTLVEGPSADRPGTFNLSSQSQGLIGWYGPLAPDDTVTVTYKVKLEDTMDATHGENIAWVPSDPSDLNTPKCVEGDHPGVDYQTGEVCAKVTLTPPVLEIAKSSTLTRPGFAAPPPYARPGDKVEYTLRIKNVGSGAYTTTHPAVVVDSLQNVLDDATWDDAAQIVSGLGALKWSQPEQRLTWSGELGVGVEVVITYSVTVKSGGDGELANVVWVPENPDSPGQPPACDQAEGEWCASDQVPLPELSIVKSVAQTPPDGAWQAGVRLTYTLTLKNTGAGDFGAQNLATVRDDLTNVLDDAVWAGVVSSPASGSVKWDSPVLTWSGPLASGETVKLVYAVDLTPAGDGRLRNVAWFPLQPDDPSPPMPDCSKPEDGLASTGEPCAEIDQLRAILEIVSKSAEGGAFARPGDTLTYTIRARNRGPVDFTATDPAVVADSLKDLLDDIEDFDPTSASDGAAGGAFTYTEPVLVWRGPLASGAEVVLTYQIRLAAGGDGKMANVAWAPKDPLQNSPLTPDCDDPAALSSGGVFNRLVGVDPKTGESCATVELLPPVIELTKTAKLTHAGSAAAQGGARAGDQVEYTLKLRNTGLGDFTDANPAVVVDWLEQVLDDCEAFDPATASDNGAVGDLSYQEPALTWSGPLAAGAEVTITYTVKLAAAGDRLLTNVAWAPEDPDAPGSAPTCPQSSGDWCATDEVRLAALSIKKSMTRALGADGLPGSRLTYTLTLTNIGPGDFTEAYPAVVRDDLTNVLDDAFWAGVLSKPAAGSLTWASPVLTWSGPLGSGATVKLVYAVDLTALGDGVLRNLVWFPRDPLDSSPPQPACSAPDSGLEPGVAEPCAVVEISRPVLEIVSKSVDSGGYVRPGDTLTYTIRARNRGPVDFTAGDPAVVMDSLAALLDDVEPFDLATASDGAAGGQFSYAEPVLTWRGPLAAGGEVTLTYTVRLRSGGDARIDNLTWSPSDPSKANPPACAAVGLSAGDAFARSASGGVDALTGEACALVELRPPVLAITKSSLLVRPGLDLTPTYARAGDLVEYEFQIDNTGLGDYTAAHPAVVVDSLADALDDAEPFDLSTASDGGAGGQLSYDEPLLRWSGSLPAGSSVTVTYRLTLREGGDRVVKNVVWAPADPEEPGEPPNCDDPAAQWCAEDEVDMPKLTIAKAAEWSWSAVTYRLTFANAGPGDFTADSPALVRDDLTAVLDDAVWVGLVSQPAAGSVTWESPVLSWTGPLAAGQTVELAYAVALTALGDGWLKNVAWFPDDPVLLAPPDCSPGEGSVAPGGEPCAEVVDQRPILEVVSKQVQGQAGGVVDGVIDARPDEWLTYTVVVRNRGQAGFTAANPAVVADSLAELLDDVEPFDLAKASDGGAGGEFSYDQPALTWRGPISAGGEVSLTYAVQLRGGGDGRLKNVAWSPKPADPPPDPPVAPGCDDPDSDGLDPVTGESCAASDVTTPVLAVAKKVQAPSPVAVGDILRYTVEVVNTSPFDFDADRPAQVIDDLSAVLDDAAYLGDAKASAGAVVFSGQRLIWTGALAAGQRADIAYSVKVVGGGDGWARNIAWAPWSGSSTQVESPPKVCQTTCSSVGVEVPARLPFSGMGGLPLLVLASLAAIAGGAVLAAGAARRRRRQT
ncbi:MAG: DUF11 domain-containing protein [Bifidobacteriaceae bacterium]|nr:DUF11 domain-containing protein [Bifidobacteriaceae bacterium]